MGGDSNRTFKAGCVVREGSGIWNLERIQRHSQGLGACWLRSPLFSHAAQRTIALLLSLLSTHGVLSGGDAGWGREDSGGLGVW